MAIIKTGDIFELNYRTGITVRKDYLLVEQKKFGSDKFEKVYLTIEMIKELAEIAGDF